MHVLMVNAHGCGDPRAGGVEAGLTTLSAGLVARGHTVSHLVAFPGGRAEPGIDVTVLHATDWRDDPVRRVRNHAGDVISRPTKALAEAVARHRPDLVHTNNLPGISTAVWEVSRRLGLPVMHTLWDYHLLCPRVTMRKHDGTTPCRPHPLLCGFRTQRLVRWAEGVSYVAGVSAYILEQCGGLFPTAEACILRTPMVLPEDERPSRPPASQLRSIGYIGALSTAKGVDVLLSAAPVLAELGCELHVAGGGPLVEAVEAAARSTPFIHYHGVVSGAEKGAFFDRCDAGIVPSVWAEPGGPNFALGEWLCAGRPVLVSGRGGLGEVSDLYTWAIRTEPTVEGLEQAFRELAEPENWEAIRARIRPVQTAEQVDQWLTAHEVIYGGLVSGRSPITSS